MRWWKFIAIWACFLLLHFSCGWLPNLFSLIIAEANETVFFHMKMLFVACVLVSLVELFILCSRELVAWHIRGWRSPSGSLPGRWE